MGTVAGVASRSLGNSYSSYFVTNYFPRQKSIPESNWYDVQTNAWSKTNKAVADLFSQIREIKDNLNFYQHNILGSSSSEVDYSEYLQFPNKKVKELVEIIVEPNDSYDEKAYKITQWVINNIDYQEDMKTYGREEYWAYPAMTISNGQGDCEDGAFLIHSLMLHAGIPPDKIRTYGGYVVAGSGASTGGHGWTTYQRQSDDEWVVLDWCYFPTAAGIDERIPMKEKMNYIDDYFYVTLLETIESPFSNLVRNPAQGNLINIYV